MRMHVDISDEKLKQPKAIKGERDRERDRER